MDLALLLAVSYFALLGSALGTFTGVVPGIHVNTLALLLVTLSPALLPLMGSAAELLGAGRDSAVLLMLAVIVSAAVAHSFLDFVPSIFLGAPDEDEALSILPGHRLLMDGRGAEAVLAAASGSFMGATVAVALSFPLYLVLGPPLELYRVLDTIIPAVIVLALISLVMSEKGGKEASASIRVRKAERCPLTVSIVRPVPVHRQAVTLCGTAVRVPLRGRWLRNGTGEWKVRGRVPMGSVRVEGEWTVRRPRWKKRALASFLILISGLLGLTATEGRLPVVGAFLGLDHSIMFPLLTGLFGLPALILSGNARPLPPQSEAEVTEFDLRSGIVGALSGGLVGWFPGISSTTGVIIGSAFGKEGRGAQSAKRFITMVSAVGTSSTVFGLLALAIAYKGRSGAMLAAKDVLGNDGASLMSLPSPYFPMLLGAVLVSAAVSFHITIGVGERFSRKVAGRPLGRVNAVLIAAMVVLAVAFCGLPGLVILAVSTLLGLVPPLLGVNRVHLTGCLLIPSLLFFMGWKDALLSVL